MSQTGSFSSGGMSKNPTFSTLVVTTALQLNAGAVEDIFNTADKVTNFEKLRIAAIANTFELVSQFGGSGVSRGVRMGTGTSGASTRYVDVSGATITLQSTNNAAGGVSVSLPAGAQLGASSGVQSAFQIGTAVNQSSTAGYTALDINPTENATGSGTKLLQRWAVGGVAKAQFDNNGNLWAQSFTVVNSGLGFSASGLGTAGDVILTRDAADTLALRRSTNAQTDRNYETYTDGSNYGRMYRAWLAGFAYFGTQAAGTGTRRPLIVQHFQTTVGALPVAATAGAGSRCHVSDALGPVFGAAVVGGGAVSVPVYSDGAVWLVG